MQLEHTSPLLETMQLEHTSPQLAELTPKNVKAVQAPVHLPINEGSAIHVPQIARGSSYQDGGA